MKDRFGLGWRAELAAGILANLDRIDVVEVIADDYFTAPRRKIRALKTLASQVPVVLHGVTLGLASAVPVEIKRLENIARLVEEVQPAFWSEHLAFVRFLLKESPPFILRVEDGSRLPEQSELYRVGACLTIIFMTFQKPFTIFSQQLEHG